MNTPIKVAEGQIWQDCDKRHTEPRYLLVLLTYMNRSTEFAECLILSNGKGRPAKSSSMPEKIGTGAIGEKTTIRVNRMTPGSTGYRLVPKTSLTLDQLCMVRANLKVGLAKIERELQAEIDLRTQDPG